MFKRKGSASKTAENAIRFSAREIRKYHLKRIKFHQVVRLWEEMRNVIVPYLFNLIFCFFFDNFVYIQVIKYFSSILQAILGCFRKSSAITFEILLPGYYSYLFFLGSFSENPVEILSHTSRNSFGNPFEILP